MRQFLILILGVLVSFWSVSQTVTITDYASKKAVSGVHIFNVQETISVVTDTLGQANLKVFSENELLVFSHTSYSQVLFKKKDLYTTKYKLELHPVILNLDEFVISANKRMQAREEVPNRITSITAKDIQLEDPQTAADLIASSGEVFVQKSQLGGGSPMIRGFSANKVLIVVDGVRMNNAIFRGGNLQNIISIDPNYIEKSEIVYGPGSVIYGSDALGGVMDFQTISPAFSDSGTIAKGHSMFRFSSANIELTPHVDFTIGTKKFSSVTSFTYSQFNDLKMGANGPEEYLRNDYVVSEDGVDKMVTNDDPQVQVKSGYKSYSILQKFGYKVNENIQLKYSFLYSTTSDIPRYDRLIQREDSNTLKYAYWNYGPQKWMMNSLSLNFNSPNNVFDNLVVTLALQNFEESRLDRRFGSIENRTKTENVDMFSANFDFDNAISGRTTMYYGFEFVYNLVHSRAVNTVNGVEIPIVTRYPNGSKYLSNAGYINFQINHSHKTTMVFGFRYNHINIDAVLDTNFYKNPELSIIKQNTGALTGSVGVAHRPNETWQLNANISSGFKAPNIDDIAKVFDSQPGIVIIPNPYLKPEYLYSVDALAGKKFGKNLKFKMELSGFYSFLIDAMVQRPIEVNGVDSIFYEGDLSQTESIVNAGSAFITGVNLKLMVNLNESWNLNGSVNYTYGKDDEGNALRHVSPLFANVHVVYTYKKLRVNTYFNYNGEISNSRMAPTELSKPHIYLEDENGDLYSPSWFTLNVKSAYNMTDKLMVTLGVENLTNQRYRAYSSGISSPGINFIGSLKATF